MFVQLGEHIAKARARAKACREEAAKSPDDGLRFQLLELEKHWNDLAASFETLKAMESFLLDSAKSKGVVLSE